MDEFLVLIFCLAWHDHVCLPRDASGSEQSLLPWFWLSAGSIARTKTLCSIRTQKRTHWCEWVLPVPESGLGRIWCYSSEPGGALRRTAADRTPASARWPAMQEQNCHRRIRTALRTVVRNGFRYTPCKPHMITAVLLSWHRGNLRFSGTFPRLSAENGGLRPFTESLNVSRRQKTVRPLPARVSGLFHFIFFCSYIPGFQHWRGPSAVYQYLWAFPRGKKAVRPLPAQIFWLFHFIFL